VWRRKFGRAPANAAERARQAGVLVRRGFSVDVVGRLMRQAARTGGVADAAADEGWDED
jgi:SOS response regulatory protein OraA/RecX